MSAKDFANIEKLTQDNYNEWKRVISAYFLTVEAIELVEGTEARPGTRTSNDAARANWEKRNRLAAGCIQMTIDQTNATHTTGIERDAAAQWKKLDEVHNNKSAGSRFNAMDALFNIRMEPSENLQSLMTRVFAAMQRVKSLRPGTPAASSGQTLASSTTTYTLDTLDNELVIMTLIRALPPDYQHIRSALLIQSSLTLDTVRDTFLAEDNQRNHAKQETITALKAFSHPTTTYQTTPFNRTHAKRPSNTPGATCTYCYLPGHTEEQCYKKQRQQRYAASRIAKANAATTDDSAGSSGNVHLG